MFFEDDATRHIYSVSYMLCGVEWNTLFVRCNTIERCSECMVERKFVSGYNNLYSWFLICIKNVFNVTFENLLERWLFIKNYQVWYQENSFCLDGFVMFVWSRSIWNILNSLELNILQYGWISPECFWINGRLFRFCPRLPSRLSFLAPQFFRWENLEFGIGFICIILFRNMVHSKYLLF